MARNGRAVTAVAAAALALALGAGAALAAEPAGPPGSGPAADLYKTYCVQCHGVKGNGNGVNVRDMSVQPRDHTDAQGMKGISDKEAFTAIKEGGPAVTKSVLMPPWGGVLSDEQIRSLVEYLRTLCKCRGRG
jgi:cytochrome c oxidase cbb3-type subunit 3